MANELSMAGMDKYITKMENNWSYKQNTALQDRCVFYGKG